MIAIVDAGLGNPRSCLRMLAHIDVPAVICGDPTELRQGDRVILPGVGHFDSAMHRLRKAGWVDAILEFAASGRPLLGICLGMQLLGTGSDEGREEGLGLMPWRCERIPSRPDRRVPHMGWNTVAASSDSKLHSPDLRERFYFVHSYFIPAESVGVSATCNYAVDIGCTVEMDNVFGVQFHPEKSHSFGMRLLKRFSEIEA